MSGVPTKSLTPLVDDIVARLQRFAAEAGQEVKPDQAKRVASDLAAAGETSDADITRAIKTRLDAPDPEAGFARSAQQLGAERAAAPAAAAAPPPPGFAGPPPAARDAGATAPLSKGYGDDLEAGLAAPGPTPPTGMSTKTKVATVGTIAAGGAAAVALQDGDQQSLAAKTAPPQDEQAQVTDETVTKAIDPKTGHVKPNWVHADLQAFQRRLDAQRPYEPLPEEYGLDADNAKQADAALTKRSGEALAEHRATLNSIANEYRAAKSETDRRELWESLIQGIGYLVAGVWGMRTKSPIQVKFAPSDWEARRRLALSERQVATAEATDERQAKLGEVQAERGQLEREWSKNAQLFQAATSAHNRKTDELYRAWDAEVRDVNSRNQLTYQETMLELQEAKYRDAEDKATDAEARRLAREQADRAKQARGIARQMGQVMQQAEKEKKQGARRAATERVMVLNDQYRELTGEPLLDLDSVPTVEDTAWFGEQIETRDLKDVRKDLTQRRAASPAPQPPSPPPAADKAPAYKDGDTRMIGGVLHTRRGGQWLP